MRKHVIQFTWEAITDVLRQRFEIPNEKDKSKPRKTKAPPTEQNSEKCDDEKQQKYSDLEQKVKAVDSRQITKESTNEAKDVNEAAAMKEARANTSEGSRAAEASEASEAEEKSSKKDKQQHRKAPQHLKSKKNEENVKNRSAETTRQEKETEGKEG